ncbi:DinB family protein [Microbispora oryzae]|uniref:DinB family protein n=1 Tax=Microbispora oryzae TaxID=2806554 RepID=UPI0027DD59BF|nr:DinB family protein [Microbispora oryzae]
MPGFVRPVTDERDALLAFLDQQRLVLRVAAHGLTDAQAASTPTVSALSVGGLIKHVTFAEDIWADIVMGTPPARSEEAYHRAFRMQPGETLASVLDEYAAVARRTEKVIGGVPDMGQAVPVPADWPWPPDGADAWSVRWVLLHLIEETARHAGHADIVRETIDGATAFPLLAAAEGWPPSPWLTPWTPAAPASS